MLKYCFIRKKYGITFSVCLHYGFLRCRSGDYQMKWSFFLCNRKQCNDVKDSNVSPVKNGIQDPKCRGFLDFRSL